LEIWRPLGVSEKQGYLQNKNFHGEHAGSFKGFGVIPFQQKSVKPIR
jgi:hypothetical protein